MKTLGEVIAIVESLNGASCGAKIKLNRIASDRWAVVIERNGITRTVATGEDILVAYKKEFINKVKFRNHEKVISVISVSYD